VLLRKSAGIEATAARPRNKSLGEIKRKLIDLVQDFFGQVIA